MIWGHASDRNARLNLTGKHKTVGYAKKICGVAVIVEARGKVIFSARCTPQTTKLFPELTNLNGWLGGKPNSRKDVSKYSGGLQESYNSMMQVKK